VFSLFGVICDGDCDSCCIFVLSEALKTCIFVLSDDIPFVFWGFGVLLTNMGFHKPLQFLQPEDFWFSAPKKGVIVIHQKKKKKRKKKGVMVFASPGEPGPQ
jgi:hypothetical protein